MAERTHPAADAPEDRPRDRTTPTERLRGSRTLRGVLLLLYLAVVLYLLAPAALAPVMGDDQVWVLRYPGIADGSAAKAWWLLFDTSSHLRIQDRSTAFAYANRAGVAVLVMNLAVLFSTAPAVLWAGLRLLLLAAAVPALRWMLRGVRFRGADGTARPLPDATVSGLALALPLAMAIGVKTQELRVYDGWTTFPTLTLGMLPSVLLMVGVATRTHDFLAADFRRRVVPVAALWVAWGVVVGYSFELLYAALPVVGVALLVHPRPRGGSPLARWRALLVVAGGLGLGWAVVYTGVKIAVGRRDCAATDSCYPGTVVEVHPHTILNNFMASMPVGGGALTRRQAHALGMAPPDPSLAAGAIALVGVLALLALLWLRTRDHGTDPAPAGLARGLGAVAAVALTLAVVATVITGVTQAAVRSITTWNTAYHVGPVVWSSMALAGLTVLALLLRRGRVWGGAGIVLATLLAVAVVTVMAPRNAVSARDNAQFVRFSDFANREVALGQLTADADARRCAQLETYLERHRPLTGLPSRVLLGVDESFEHYHHRRFCSTVDTRAYVAAHRPG